MSAACWLKKSERRYWDLYVASSKITEENFDEALNELPSDQKQCSASRLTPMLPSWPV